MICKCIWEEYPLGTTQPRIQNCLAEKDLQDLGCLFQPKWYSESAACPWSKGQLYLGLQQLKWNQQIRASDSSLFEALGDTPWVSHPVLGIPLQERHQHAGAGLPGRWEAREHRGCERRLRKQEVLTTRERSGGVSLLIATRWRKDIQKEDRARVLSEVHWGRMIGDRWKLEHKTF